MRILGLDFGSKTVGVAVSDQFGWTAQGLETIRRKDTTNLVSTYERIEELCAQYQVEKIVLGLPKHMNNTEGDRVEKTKVFAKHLAKRTKLPIEFWDERLSTLGAGRQLLEADMSRKKREQIIDKMAAQYILQGYLDAAGH
ncbi:Holliday junction resolvase RuvX [Anaerotalea alkaliphila]|nr:Holliday junction resolvase RuvX [Anaerotalea alkaliphila]